ncbi:YggS family pyridoxal phosphate-dependent enzyme [Microvirga tunisiensis]|uniref:Pyridoxal phosphate homeostasis protein n=1 Tax=Microvirga tunisiensis TaxID=2108360 RepID=A0A5N7MED2_9HYPH|nr:YggS family pyridoxal phosphate-dependent enzyme [Microvirga tunisiensis]MPR07021.1 YggS family pyridoxal phosphate-dependent enzyme [Microvirga tunisiensis]MPR25312.1 YggS family pyridoxal phosphate-dependent enzyme [Microvirga tunisiensis]
MSENGAVEGLKQVQESIRRAASDYGRDLSSITLVAVSKTFPVEEIEPVLAAGQRVFGENYVQEAKAKWPALRERFADVELHMIGPLQSNKAREAVELFDVIHTLDRPSLAEALAKEIVRQGKRPRLLVQVNTGEEPQKGGVIPAEVDAFLEACRSKYGLEIAGLMCIPPAEDPPSPHFALLNTIARRHGLAMLSMGMSADFDAAIQLGATHVRVGSAIFGSRPKA